MVLCTTNAVKYDILPDSTGLVVRNNSCPAIIDMDPPVYLRNQPDRKEHNQTSRAHVVEHPL